MTKLIKICSPFVPGLTVKDDSALGDEVATNERIDNVRITPLRGAGRPRAAVELMKLLLNGRTLRVKFLDGNAAVQTKVQAIAKEWETLSNLKLDFVSSGAAQIRISFAEEGFSWSTVGTDALTVPGDEPTMNYGWLEPDTDLREYQRVVRHERQSRAAVGQIAWDKASVDAYCAQGGWSKADVDVNIFEVYGEDSANLTAVDKASIMQYAVADSLPVGSFAIGWNTEFSPV